MIDEIPMLMASGEFHDGNKFVNYKGLWLSGEIISNLYVDEKYEALAKYLDCTELIDIHYDDIDIETEYISDEDIEDFQEFTYYSEIIQGYVSDGVISEEQIERFNLQYFKEVEISNSEIYYEDFPGQKVKDIKRLRRHIREQFKKSPNPYIIKQREVRVPSYEVDKNAYTSMMYGSINNEGKCFCQMCKHMVDMRYIERNDVEKEPEFGWEQMYLCLCLTCSKDYTLLRNNKTIWKKFIEEIKNANVEDRENVEIEIGESKSITFTGTHLAEIQAILSIIPDNDDKNR